MNKFKNSMRIICAKFRDDINNAPVYWFDLENTDSISNKLVLIKRFMCRTNYGKEY